MDIRTLRAAFANLPMTREIKEPKQQKATGLLSRFSPDKKQGEDKKMDARHKVAQYVQEIREEKRKLKDGR